MPFIFFLHVTISGNSISLSFSRVFQSCRCMGQEELSRVPARAWSSTVMTTVAVVPTTLQTNVRHSATLKSSKLPVQRHTATPTMTKLVPSRVTETLLVKQPMTSHSVDDDVILCFLLDDVHSFVFAMNIFASKIFTLSQNFSYSFYYRNCVLHCFCHMMYKWLLLSQAIFTSYL